MRKRIALSVFLALLLGGALPALAQDEGGEGSPLGTVDRGKRLYKDACMACHGILGNGRGPASVGLDPRPRDFTQGVFKWRTTKSGSMPTEGDLERTIREGVPGTAMPGWGNVFSLDDRMSLVKYVKTFSPAFRDPEMEKAEIPEERGSKRTPASIEAGRKLFVANDCVKCHGAGGQGDGPEAVNQKDEWEVPIRPANLTNPYLKGGRSDLDIFRTLSTGLSGTPMPAFDELPPQKRWQLVDFVQSLKQKGLYFTLFVEKPTAVSPLQPEPEEAAEN